MGSKGTPLDKQSHGNTLRVRNVEFDLVKDQIIRDHEMQLRLCMVMLLNMHAAIIARPDQELTDDFYANLGEDLDIGGDKARLWMYDVSTSEWTVRARVTISFEDEGEYETTLVSDRELGLRFEGNLTVAS